MGIMRNWRIRSLFKRGWRDAGEIVHYPDVQKSRFSVYFDILSCFRKYYVFSNQYKSNKIWNLLEEERGAFCNSIGKANRERDKWFDDYYENRRFLNKYTSRKYENSPKLIRERKLAYTERYHLGKNCIIQFNVEFSREHLLNGTLKVGNNVLFAKNVFIDYSGGVTLEDNVKLSASVVIESHRHEFDPDEKKHKAIPTTILIEEGVWVGQKAVICEEVKRIGRFAQIGAGAVVRNPVPPYSIVVGNPAKIVGFLYTPEEVKMFEEDKYSEAELTDIEKYRKLYEKYFINRIIDIKKTLNN